MIAPMSLLLQTSRFQAYCLCSLLVCVIPGSIAVAVRGQEPERKYAKEFHHTFSAQPSNADDLRKMGLDNDRLVQFTADGLRITLPVGGAKVGSGVGVVTGFGVRGDFEITARYQIVLEPAPTDPGAAARVALTVRLDKPNPDQHMATLNRRIAPKGPQYFTALNLGPGDTGKRQSRVTPTKVKAGRLRLVRTGADLAYLAAEGNDETFKLLDTFALGTEDVKDVRVIGSLGNDKASLDVRFIDLHIRADALPRPKGAEIIVVPQADYAQEYYHSFKGNPRQPTGWDHHGPANAQTVRFEREGLRIALPAGFDGERPGTGIQTRFGVKGDFEITIGYEILQGPAPEEIGKASTRLSLAVVKDTPFKDSSQSEVATHSRSIAGKGNQIIVAWMRLHDPTRDIPPRAKVFPNAAKAGQLRLVRNGGDLYYLKADGVDGTFKALAKFPFGPEDLYRIEIAGSTGGEKASLDARVCDIHIRAQELPRAPATGPPPVERVATAPDTAEPALERDWLMTALWIGASVIVLMAAVAGVAWVRRGRKGVAAPALEPAPTVHAATPGIVVACTGCGKRLRVKGALAGKKVKCPGCGSSIQVSAASAGGTDHPDVAQP
jgi:hypothetical protein